ncbi:hypothetical protein HOL34_03700 [bacterium]|jgi:hypothetical protein|nr:hypothetical protein [bacterium]MBT3903942.1 hypothetical protein [bacterium]MBT4578222.1 hypothetical protein [bacterium]MBT5346057.1 hypothetical protein [bacterium]MBT6130803.1 hypothetical protein [bacterium]
MKIIQQIQVFLTSHTLNEVKRALLIAAAAITALTGSLMYYRYHTLTTIYKNIRTINKRRIQAAQIIGKNTQLNEAKKYIKTLLIKDRDFMIAQFFDDNIKKQGLTSKVSKKVTSRHALKDDYQEIRLNASLLGINTKQLVKLLHLLEEKQRVYIKELDISHASSSAPLEVNLVIATLEIGKKK